MYKIDRRGGGGGLGGSKNRILGNYYLFRILKADKALVFNLTKCRNN